MKIIIMRVIHLKIRISKIIANNSEKENLSFLISNFMKYCKWNKNCLNSWG